MVYLLIHFQLLKCRMFDYKINIFREICSKLSRNKHIYSLSHSFFGEDFQSDTLEMAVIILIRLIVSQMEFRSVSNQSENCNYHPKLVPLNNIQKV